MGMRMMRTTLALMEGLLLLLLYSVVCPYALNFLCYCRFVNVITLITLITMITVITLMTIDDRRFSLFMLLLPLCHFFAQTGRLLYLMYSCRFGEITCLCKKNHLKCHQRNH